MMANEIADHYFASLLDTRGLDQVRVRSDHLDLLGPAMFSISGRGDRWRMIALLADVDWRAAKAVFGSRATLATTRRLTLY